MSARTRVIVVDNHDSFTWNLVQALRMLDADVRVFYSDRVSVGDLAAERPDALLVSPGPSAPRDAGVSIAAIRAFAGRVPVLGVCLGHQAIGEAFGASVVRARTPMHGKTSEIRHDGEGLFRGLPSPFRATRYHSLVVDAATLPAALVAQAFSEDGELMALRHAELEVHGVQFHPESFLSERGDALLANWLAAAPRTA